MPAYNDLPLSEKLLLDFDHSCRPANCNFDMSIGYRDWLIAEVQKLEDKIIEQEKCIDYFMS